MKIKCSSCGKEIETTFLNKIKGNYIKKNGKLEALCSECFRKEHEK
ncbi:MAG: hypothetical protein CSMARM5_0056 [Candidatus Parvarchaeum acidophilus ARMAN-5_'5-way FS']|jgi:NMD protein affecting ribosome stability and mRNA decay|uniref:Uncharacterized protein n=1 Tax=Candidatus Parvarchaeum acidophilus ARMAN-5_'5-way FS' TaxID=994838 RepID=F2UU82_PARA5|nr:MAG: hypothetical protein CSMARM5_0056 [Candidatus Parvarchaeum acidophilus ARMAN-5_'5-way FS']